jgi:hypothetical protein
LPIRTRAQINPGCQLAALEIERTCLVDLIFVWLRDQCAKGPNNRWKLYTGRVLKSPENLFPSKSPREIKLGSK